MKNCVVIYNPNSGKGIHEKILNKIEKVLDEYNYTSTIYKTEHKGHAKEIVESLPNTDLIISIGGDGTFNEIMTGNFNRKQRLLLSHIPVGTANDLGAMYGYGKNLIRNLKLLLNGQIKKIDICTINGKPFTYSAGTGKFINISYETSRESKKKFGYLAYLMGAFKDLNCPTELFDITYEVNNEKISGKYSLLLISNANRIAGIKNFYKNIKLNDNLFEVLLCDVSAKGEFIKGFYKLKTSDITKTKGFYFYKTNKFVITFNKKDKIKWSLDGEKYEDDNNRFEIEINKDIKILLPNKNIKKLFVEE